MSIPTGLDDLLRKLVLHKNVRWQDDYTAEGNSDREVADGIGTAEAASSMRRAPGRHAILLDLDVPAYLMPSSTGGHSHLYIDVDVTSDQLTTLLDVLVDCGVVEPGYAAASLARGFTALRLPWVKKPATTTESDLF